MLPIKLPIKLDSIRAEDWTFRFIETHLQSDFFDIEVWKRFKAIQKKDKKSRWFAMGDIIDPDRGSMRIRKAQIHSDRKDALKYEYQKNRTYLKQDVVPILWDLRDTCGGLLDGDHYLELEDGQTSGQFLAEELKVPYLGERMAQVCAQFYMTMGHHTCGYKMFLRHGNAAGSTMGGDVNSLIKENTGFDGYDLYVGAHSHQNNATPVKMIGPNNKCDGFNERMTWYLRCSSFLRGYCCNGKISYAEKKGYRPLPTGWGEAKVHAGRTGDSKTFSAVCNLAYTLAF